MKKRCNKQNKQTNKQVETKEKEKKKEKKKKKRKRKKELLPPFSALVPGSCWREISSTSPKGMKTIFKSSSVRFSARLPTKIRFGPVMAALEKKKREKVSNCKEWLKEERG